MTADAELAPSAPVATPPHLKLVRFVWRVARNFFCLVPGGRNALFPPVEMASRFGPDDIGYGVRVFEHHWQRLTACGMNSANSVLEVGPGRNVVTAILFWAALTKRSEQETVTVTLWDVFANMTVNAQVIAEVATALLERPDVLAIAEANPTGEMVDNLRGAASGQVLPKITHTVATSAKFFRTEVPRFDLVYSHAAIEHVWHIALFWKAVIAATKLGGWCSHRIDLADHGRRETNYIEMLEWSATAYWLMLRFVPGATNRWRACHHLDFVTRNGLELLQVDRVLRPALPVSHNSIASEFRDLPQQELRAVALDFVARRRGKTA